MAKKQIRINETTIKEMVRRAINEWGGVDVARNKGVWSSDDPEAAEDMKNMEDSDRAQAAYFGYRDPGNDFSDLMFKRANGEDSEFSRRHEYVNLSPRSEDERMRDEFGDEEAESEMYDENPEGTENMWDNEEGYDDEEYSDEDELYPMYEGKKQIRMNEQQLRNFISYSVARLLREGLEHGENGEPDEFDKRVIKSKKDQEEKDKGKKPNKAVLTHFSTKKDGR